MNIEEKINARFDEIDKTIKGLQETLNKKGYSYMTAAIDALMDVGASDEDAKAEKAQIIPGIDIWETRAQDAVAYVRKIGKCDDITADDETTYATDTYGHYMTVADLKRRGAIPFGGEWVYEDKIINEVKRRKSNLRDDLRYDAEKLAEKAKDDREQWINFEKYYEKVSEKQALCTASYRLDFSDFLSDAKTERLSKVRAFSRRKTKMRGLTDIVMGIDEDFGDFLDWRLDAVEDSDDEVKVMWYGRDINLRTVDSVTLYNSVLLDTESAAKDEKEYEEELRRNESDEYYSDDDEGEEEIDEPNWDDIGIVC